MKKYEGCNNYNYDFVCLMFFPAEKVNFLVICCPLLVWSRWPNFTYTSPLNLIGQTDETKNTFEPLWLNSASVISNKPFAEVSPLSLQSGEEKKQKETSLMFKQLQVWQREVENWWHTTFTTSASVDAEQLCSSNVKHWRDDVIKNFILLKTAHMLWNMLRGQNNTKMSLNLWKKMIFLLTSEISFTAVVVDAAAVWLKMIKRSVGSSVVGFIYIFISKMSHQKCFTGIEKVRNIYTV